MSKKKSLEEMKQDCRLLRIDSPPISKMVLAMLSTLPDFFISPVVPAELTITSAPLCMISPSGYPFIY
jgi:hypothetical protein